MPLSDFSSFLKRLHWAQVGHVKEVSRVNGPSGWEAEAKILIMSPAYSFAEDHERSLL